jgi:polyisoprenoid-binding protein YceI
MRVDALFRILLAAAATGCGGPVAEPAPAGPPEPNPQPVPSGQHFKIDPATSRMSAHVGTAGLLSGMGHEHTMAIRDFDGEVVVSPGTITPASLRMSARPASIAETDPGFSEADRQKIDEHVRGKALEVSKFDRISFQSTAVSARPTAEGSYELEITGILELHGVRKSVIVTARLDLWGEALAASGEFTIRHSDFGMERLSAALGTVKASDEIKISFVLRARRSD